MSWKITAVAILIGLLSTGWFYVQSRDAKADLEMEFAMHARTKDVLTQTRGQLEQVQNSLANARATITFLGEELKASNAEVERLQANRKRSTDRTNRDMTEINDAPDTDNGPAAPVLEYAANSLRDTAQRITSLCAGHCDSAGVSGIQSVAGNDNASVRARSTWPQTQRQFGVVAIDFGRFGEQCAQQLVAIRQRVDNSNAAIRERNALTLSGH